VSENRVLRDEVTGSWRKLLDEEVHNLYSSPDIRLIKSRTVRWSGYAARMGKMRNAYTVWLGSLKGPDHSEDLGVDGKIILK
jgi:hypothetical protein